MADGVWSMVSTISHQPSAISHFSVVSRCNQPATFEAQHIGEVASFDEAFIG
jgi:hypothetical protein